MQEASDESVTSGRGSLGQPAAKSAERIYSEILKPPKKDDDETSESNDLEKLSADSADGINTTEVNIWENPFDNNQELIEGSYEEPPPKPPHTLPEYSSECSAEQSAYHDVCDINEDYTSPETPLCTETNGGDEMVEEETSDNSKPKFGKKKVFKLKKLSSYENISKFGLEDTCSTGRSTESIKEAVKAAKRAKERCSVASCPKAKIVFGISAGLLVGTFCFLFLYLLVGRHVLTALVVTLITGVVTSLVLGFFDATRLTCIVLLIFPSLCSSGAKVSLWILLTYFLISGPLCNFIQNVRITAQTRGCMMENRSSSAYVTPTASAARQQRQPQRDPRTQYLIDNIEQFENLTSELGSFLNKTLKAGNKDNRNNGGSMSSGLICESQLSKAKNACSIAYESLYKNCTMFLQRWGLHRRCAQFILRKSGCQHLSDLFIQSTCVSIDSARLLPLNKMALILQKQPKPTVEPSYSKENHSKENHTENHTPLAFNNARAVTEKVSKPREALVIVRMLLPLLILVVLFEAYQYHKRYLVYIEFDNCYLTLLFGSIENTRRVSGATDGLMPLKKSELQKYVQPTSCGLSRAEKKSLFNYFVIFLVYAAFALLLLLGDVFFYRAVTSEEPAAVDTTKALPGCEADLKKPDEVHTLIIPVLLGLLFLLIILQAYVLRLRRYIAARFYRTRERKRVTYLYYKLLEDRKEFFKSTIEKINKVSEENDSLNRLDVMLVLAHRFPAFGKVMTFLGLSLKRCMVCGTGLNKKYVTCDTEECGAVYCRMCFWDVESNCLGCMRKRTPVISAGKTAHGKENVYV